MPHRGIVLPPPILLPFPCHLFRRHPFLFFPLGPSFLCKHKSPPPLSSSVSISPPWNEEETSFKFLPLPRYPCSPPPLLLPLSPSPHSPALSSLSPPVDCCLAEPIIVAIVALDVPEAPLHRSISHSSAITVTTKRQANHLRHRSPVRRLFPAKHENEQLLLAAIVMRGGKVKHKI